MKQLLIAVFIMLAYVGMSQSEFNGYSYYNTYDRFFIPKKTIKKKGVNKITTKNY